MSLLDFRLPLHRVFPPVLFFFEFFSKRLFEMNQQTAFVKSVCFLLHSAALPVWDFLLNRELTHTQTHKSDEQHFSMLSVSSAEAEMGSNG